MKRLLSAFVFGTLLSVTCAPLSSCGKDDIANDLYGTYWIADLLGAHLEILFLPNNQVKSKMSKVVLGETRTQVLYGFYSYSPPDISITMETEYGSETKFGTIEGDSMILIERGAPIVFTRETNDE